LLRDALHFKHHALTGNRRLHDRADGCGRTVCLLAAKDCIDIHLAGG
jgi:hypothetical protein